MDENKYFVTIDHETIAENMSLEIALMLVKAVFNEYYNDNNIVLAIEEMPVALGTTDDGWVCTKCKFRDC